MVECVLYQGHRFLFPRVTQISLKKKLQAQEGDPGKASHVVTHDIEHGGIPQGLKDLYQQDVYHIRSAILLRNDWDKSFDLKFIYIDATKEHQVILLSIQWLGYSQRCKGRNEATTAQGYAKFPTYRSLCLASSTSRKESWKIWSQTS